MRSLESLREALAAETAGLAPRRTAEEIVQAGQRRQARRRAMAVASAFAAVVALAVPAVFWPVGGGQTGEPTVAASRPTANPGETRPAPADLPCTANAKTAPAIGRTIWTGTTNSQGQELVARFFENRVGDANGAGLGIGLGAKGRRVVKEMDCVFAFALPPSPGYYGHSSEFDGPDFSGPDKTTTIVDSFVGPVDRITASYDGRPLTVHFVRWSAHADMVVYWVTGVPAGAALNPRDGSHPLVTIYDAAGNVIGQPGR